MYKIQKSIGGAVNGCLARSQILRDLPCMENMDLFGPVEIRDEVIKRGPRTCKKVWLVIFVCTRTRGVYLDICTDYSTESVLHVVRRLMALKGDVKLIISDCGSNLLAASKEMQIWRKGWDKAELIRFCFS